MNPQPPEYVGNIVAVLFACFVIFLTIREYLFGAIKYPSDKFVIGYFLDDDTVTKTTTTNPPTMQNKPYIPPHDPPNDPPDDPKNDPPITPFKPPKAKKNKSNKRQNNEGYKTIFETDQLYLDCVDALYALGMKKLEAKKTAKNIFNSSSHRPSTIQDFLMIALSKK
jgi:hypothetical protein